MKPGASCSTKAMNNLEFGDSFNVLRDHVAAKKGLF